MTVETPWRRLWTKIDAALFAHGERLAQSEGQFLKEVRLAVARYGRAVDPEAFDVFGQALEAEEA